MTDLEFITEYRKMKKISDICKEYGIDHTNLIYGRTTKENTEIVANILKNEIKKIYSEIILDRSF